MPETVRYPTFASNYEVNTALLDRDMPLDQDQLQESPCVYQVSPAERKAHFVSRVWQRICCNAD